MYFVSVGLILKFDYNHHLEACLVIGKGSNMHDELVGPWGLLNLTSLWQIELMVTGDSKVVRDWFEGRSRLQVLSLHFWKNKVLDLKHKFSSISTFHIHKIFNKKADHLSKWP